MTTITRCTFVRGTLVGGASLLVPLFVSACARGRGAAGPPLQVVAGAGFEPAALGLCGYR